MHAEQPEDEPNGKAPSDVGAELLGAHGETVGKACMAWLGERAAAQAAVEETFVQAREGLTSRGAEGSVRGWLFGLAQRACARRLEAGPTKTAPLRATTQPLPSAGASASGPSTERLPGSPFEHARRALLALPPTERDAVVLLYVAGLDLADTAQAARVDERTARERANRGLVKLRAKLANNS